MEKPTCKWCGKPLRKHILTDYKSVDEPPTEYKDRPVLKVTSRYEFINGETFAFNVWLGDWGGYGDNCFCGQRCGYKWAVSQQKQN